MTKPAPDAVPEAFPNLQYSKGWGRCELCKLTRPMKELVKESVESQVLVHCRDAKECAQMKDLREVNLRELPPMPPPPLPEPEEREIVGSPRWWNLSPV